jgi:MoxR-like ATPase
MGFRSKVFTGRGDQAGNRFYVIPPDKAKRVNFSIQLGKPLLVEGEAGCGKTQLAYAIACELGLDEPIVIPVRSSSRVNDMFYRFDALRRLQDTHIAARQAQAEKAHNYISLEPLGTAIAEGLPKVVLIDEVDKGDMDFQNDLLFALERFQFPIDEIPASETKSALKKGLRPIMTLPPGGEKPIIIFTSNREKALPKPFLRRCIFLELTFPDRVEDLVEIVEKNLHRRRAEGLSEVDSLASLSRHVIARAVDSFLEIRKAAGRNNAMKTPATAELIDWVHILHLEQTNPEEIQGTHPPFWDVLFKSAEDQDQQRRSEGAGGGVRGA